jgi:uncharacterized protein (DUF58 family)
MMADMILWNDQRLRLTLTRLGIQYLAALSLLGFFAVNSGNNLLYLVFSLMLGLFLVSGWVSRRAIQGLKLLAIEEGNIFARVKGGIRVRLLDAHPRRIRALEIHLDLEQTRVEPSFYAGGQRDAEAVLIVLHARPDFRGWSRIRQLELCTRYPFGFLEKAWRFPVEKAVLVLPHPRSATLRGEGQDETQHSIPKPGCTSPEGARPFRIGDSLSQVHWKRTAQRGIPWVRTFDGERPTGLHLHLDLRLWAPGTAFEKELERLSGAILQARLQKEEVFLAIHSSEGLLERSGPTECWRALAVTHAQRELQADHLKDSNDSAAFAARGMAIL